VVAVANDEMNTGRRRSFGKMEPGDYKEIFQSAVIGELYDIMVLDVTLSDWQLFFQYLSAKHKILYEEAGEPKPLPNFDVVFERYAETPVTVKVCFPDFTVNCFFFDVEVIEMDVLPTDINSPSRAELIFKLMSDVACLLGKPVIMTPESTTHSPEEVLCFADPSTGEITKTI
jgi:hypothetical protein